MARAALLLFLSLGVLPAFSYPSYAAASSRLDADSCVTWTDVTTDLLGGADVSRGCAWVDYDNDGDLDISVTNDPSLSKLLRNDGLSAESFVDATPAIIAGITEAKSTAWGDYDKDGDLDVYVVRALFGVLLRNNGGGNFSSVGSGPDDPFTGQMASWADYDNDGDVDIYMSYIGENRLYRNDGGGVFTDVTSGPLGYDGNSMGIGWADYDNDGDQDLFIATRDLPRSNKLLRNDGGGIFTDVTPENMRGTYNYPSAGVAWGDYDNDGDLDLYVTNDGPNNLFRNDGGGVFTDVAEPPVDDYWAYGRSASWADYDLDGDLDLYVVNNAGTSKLFRNDGPDGFVLAPSCVQPSPVEDPGVGFAASWGDYDKDGDLDIYLANNGRNKLFRNDQATGRHWLQVRLIGDESNSYGQGARVWVVAGGKTQMREIAGASGYHAQDPLVAFFGLDQASLVDTLRIVWPSTVVQTLTGVASDQRLEITEEGMPRPPRTWVIRPDGTGDWPTIKAGINNALAGDTVLVMSGTYYESDINLRSGIYLTSETGTPDCVTIDGQRLEHRVLYCDSVDSTASVVGLTIHGGAPAANGGGMYCRRSYIRFVNCAFVHNSSLDFSGGGAYLAGGSPVFIDCVFAENTIAHEMAYMQAGGGVHSEGGAPRFTRCIFSKNHAELHGGGFSCSAGCSPTFEGCIFVGNGAHEGGGGMAVGAYGAPPAVATIRNCTFYGNSSLPAGGSAVWTSGECSATLENVIIAFNGGGIPVSRDEYQSGPPYPVLTCCDLFGNHYGDWVPPIDDQYGIRGNIRVDPLFCDTAEVDLHLLPGSPCLDTDSCGTYGAYGVCAQAGVPDEIVDGTAYRLYPSVPNPSAGAVAIEYDLPEPTTVDLVVYDAMGRVVRKLAEGRLEQAGRRSATWDGRNAKGVSVAPGIYFCELRAGSFRQTQRMLLLR